MARILVVDDSVFLVKQLCEFLESEGHEVVGVGHNGYEGLELFIEHKPDLMMLDITMPKMDGEDCLRDVLEHDEQARVLMVSAVSDPRTIESVLDIGAAGFVEKPVRFGDAEFCAEFRKVIAEAIEC